nr:PREDICTED: uncharacterized protein LOC103375141 [Stegastes partitus]
MSTTADPHLDPLQFAYRANRSVYDPVLHFILQHLDSPGSYARILFVNFNSAFNTIIPALLQDKLSQLNVPDSTCRWITDFLSDRKHHMKLGKHISDSRTISTKSPQDCFLSPLLFLLYTNSCTSSHQSVKLLKFADDTTLTGPISDGDESAYRRETERLVSWCRLNNLELNALNTVEMIMDFRRNTASLTPITLSDCPVDPVEPFCFLGTIITQDLKWELNTSSLIRKAQQRMYFLQQLKKFRLPTKMMVHLYTSVIESIITSSITIWHAAATAKDKARLQRIIRSAEKVIGCNLPSLQDLHASRTLRCADRVTSYCPQSSIMMESILLTVLCLSGWLILPSCPLRQYHFVNEPLTWNEAQSYCRETYTDLATTESMTELNQLIDTVSSSGHKSEVWIGLYTEIDWRWSDGFTGSGAEYRKWGYGEPDSLFAREFCVFISSTAQWYDAYCPSDRSVVCYKGTQLDPEYVAVNKTMSWSSAQKYCRENFIDLPTLQDRLKEKGVSGVTLKWREQPDGKVWHKEVPQGTTTGC